MLLDLLPPGHLLGSFSCKDHSIIHHYLYSLPNILNLLCLPILLPPTSTPSHLPLFMPDKPGKSMMLSHRLNSTATTITTSNPMPHNSELTAKLASTTGPVKNTIKAKAYLEQRSLITIDNNYDFKTLADLLITTTLDSKIPDQATNIIRAVTLLMVSKIQNKYTDEITSTAMEKLQTPTSNMLNQLKCKNKFLSASGTNQTNHTQHLLNLITPYNTVMSKSNATILIANISTMSLQIPQV